MDIEHVLAQLTFDEKAGLTAGADMWNIAGVERLGIPQIRVTDGPNGARGSALLGVGTVTAACVPCGSALGATWDPGARRGGRGRDRPGGAHQVVPVPARADGQPPSLPARRPQLRVLLRGPAAVGQDRRRFRAGRAVTRVWRPRRSTSSGNEAEFERTTMSSDIDERTLRELYLRPVRAGGHRRRRARRS